MGRPPFCSVIIINYNGKDLMERFLPSIESFVYPRYEVIIIDNSSTDNSAIFVKCKYPQFKLIENQQNLGTAEGSNIGIPHANGEYILWLSNDMEVDPFLLRRMIDTAESSSDIGICTCKMRRLTVDNQKTNVIDSVGIDVDIFGFPSDRGINEEDVGQVDEVKEIFAAHGGAMLVKREVLDKVGGYDPTFFTLADDIDLSWRVHLAGYKVVVEPKALLYHRVSATLGKFGRSERRYMSEKNTFRMLLKNYSTLTLIGLIPLYLALLVSEVFFFLILRKFRIVSAYFRAVGWNIRSFKNIWREHVKIQRSRIISDKDIRRMMYKRSFKIKILRDYLKDRHGESWRDYFGEPTKTGGKKA